jgi:hypothetical protein
LAFITPRSGAALAADNPIFSKLRAENRFGVPFFSVIISSSIACIIALSGSFIQLITISVVCRFIQHIATCTALFSLEKKVQMNSFSYSWQRLIPFFALLSMGILLCFAEPYQLLFGSSALIVAIPLYWIQKKLVKRAAIPA